MRCAGQRVAVVGDLIADEFIYGEIARVSREAPVLILNYDSTEIVPGGAGNAAANVAALGGSRPRRRSRRPRRAGRPAARHAEAPRASTSATWFAPAGYRTPTKTRILAGGIHSAKQQVVRIDRAATPRVERRRSRAAFEARVLAAVERLRRAARVRLRQRPGDAAAGARSAAGRA